jgi:hypothetical protein
MAEIQKRSVGRPKGSTKKSLGSGVFITNLEKQTENCAITKDSSMGWRKWGVDNLYCNKLLDLYSQSPTHSACINFGVQSILGEGVDYEQSKFDGNEIAPNPYESWDSLIRSVSLDFLLYGSYAIQCILNKDGKTLSYYHIALDKVRWGNYDEDGQITEYFISADWSALGANPPIRIAAFDMRPDMKLEKGVPYLYVFRPYSPLQSYYTTPHYAPAIKAIQSEIEFINWDIKHITNGFAAAGFLTLPEVETDEERQAIINNVQKMFVGSQNSNAIAIAFRNNVEDKPVEYTPITQSTNSVNLYADSNQRCVNRILCAHQIPDPQLVGSPLLGGNGFNSEGRLLEVAYNIYNKVVGNYNRQCVIKTFNFMLALNGIETEIVMKPLKFTIDESESANVDKDNAEIDGKDYTEDKIEEKVEK